MVLTGFIASERDLLENIAFLENIAQEKGFPKKRFSLELVSPSIKFH